MSKYSNNMPSDLKRAIGWLYDYIEADKDFLDFGCSTGYFGALVKTSKNCRVYGVEVSDDVQEARKVLDGVYSFDLDGIWPDEVYERKYDYLFFGDVLEHLKDPGEVLRKAKKLTSSSRSRVFVSIPNIAHISTRLELMQGGFEYEPMGILDNTHLKYFTLDSFSRLANEAGYKILSVDYSVNDYPHEVVNNILEKVGLKPNKDFWKTMDSIEARAYQYKFILSPAGSAIRQQKLPTRPLPDKPEHQRDEFIADLRHQVEVLKNHSDDQGKIMSHLSDLNNQLIREKDALEEQLKKARAYSPRAIIGKARSNLRRNK